MVSTSTVDTRQMIVSCLWVVLCLALFSPQAQALYCLQCESSSSDMCRMGLVPPTKCLRPGARACVTMVGKLAGGNYVARSCTRNPKGTYCRNLKSMPGFPPYEICLRTCYTSGCNDEPDWDYGKFNYV